MSPLSGAAALHTLALVSGSLAPWPELMIMGTAKGRSAKSRYIKDNRFLLAKSTLEDSSSV